MNAPNLSGFQVIKNYTPEALRLRAQCLEAIAIEQREYQRRVAPYLKILGDIEAMTTHTLVLEP